MSEMRDEEFGPLMTEVSLRAQVAVLEGGDVAALRRENEELRAQVATLRDLLAKAYDVALRQKGGVA